MATDGKCIQVFVGHDGAVTNGGFTKDGKFVYTGGEDGTVRIWAPKSGKCKHLFKDSSGHEALVTSFDSSDDGDLLLSGNINVILENSLNP